MLSAPPSIVVDGAYGRFEGSPEDRVVLGHYARHGDWSPELSALIAQQLLGEAGGTLIDVGANIGLCCIPVLQRSAARAIAFEPAPDNFEFLRRNLARHRLSTRVTAHPLALWDAPGRMTFRTNRENSGDQHLSTKASRLDTADAADAPIRVATAALDQLLAPDTLTAPVVMKVDTQGAEARVLRGARRTLERVDWLIVEYWPFGLHRMGESVAALREELQRFPWACVLSGPGPGPLAPTAEVLRSLSWIADDGSDAGFFDLLLGRRQLSMGQ